ncbi:hypothetical protein N665_0511s0004 [Sinapis alba]|nr:hypothetical protein N665_0511s0004 [Sinapis alba]
MRGFVLWFLEATRGEVLLQWSCQPEIRASVVKRGGGSTSQRRRVWWYDQHIYSGCDPSSCLADIVKSRFSVWTLYVHNEKRSLPLSLQVCKLTHHCSFPPTNKTEKRNQRGNKKNESSTINIASRERIIWELTYPHRLSDEAIQKRRG